MPSVDAEAWTWVAVVLATSVAGVEGLTVVAVVVGLMGSSLEVEGQVVVEDVEVLVVEARTRSSAWVARTRGTEAMGVPLLASGLVGPENLDFV